jgi:outer membrane receptor protein involved in Fe transport
MQKKLLFVFSYIFFFCFASSILAGTTGKISGKVTDKETGEPIPGINVILQGTTMGAATDIDGNFIINNIPPGNYNVLFSGVGYQKRSYVNVKVAVDFTTRLDVILSTEDVALETIVVQAEAPLIRKDLTSSHTSIDASQIEALPVEGITQLLTLQAGIVQGAGGELHIRGGRSTEISYAVNGVSISNPFDNTRSVSIATNAIQELSVVSGTFNAEYGNALSGIVNTVTKEGSSKYKGFASFYTGDYISSHDDIFYNINDINPLNNYVGEFTFSGPIPLLENYLTFFISGRYNDDGGYLYGKREQLPTDSVWKNPMNPNDIRVSSSGDGKDVAMDAGKSFSGTGKITFRPLTTLKINYDFLFSKSKQQYYNHDLKYNPDANLNNYEWGMLNSIEIRHALSNSTFYTVQGSYNINDYKQYLYPLLDASGNEVDFYAGMSLDGLHADPRYQPDYKSNVAANYTFMAGGTLNSHYYQRSQTYGAKFDITSQINNNHEVKFGAQYKYHVLDYENFSILRDSVRYIKPTIAPLNTAYHDSYQKKPVEFSAYIQDKMEFDKLIVNVGLRYDYFDANSKYSTDIYNPSPNNPNLPSTVDPTKLLADSPSKHQFSPRIGLSFPITETGIIHFSYGHFFQMPTFRNLYVNPDFKYSFSVGTPTFGNANLNPEKTITYEIGLQQQLAEDIAFNITGYYKDVRDLLAIQQIRISGDETYYMYVNKDYANNKGITVSLVKRRTATSMLGFSLDYTFSVSEGNETNTDAFFMDLSSGRQSEKIPVLLGWDQTHTLNGTLSIGEPRDWNITLVGRIGTGLPYTPQMDDTQIYLRTNSGRKPSQITVDLLADKVITLFGFDFSFFVKVFNLFDTLNERYIYNDTGRATYSLVLNQTPAQETNKLSERIPGVKSAKEYFVRPQYYAPPREVRIGFSVEF